MNAFIEAYPYIVLYMGLFAASVTILNGAICSCTLMFGTLTDELGSRLFVSGVATAASTGVAALILTFTKWLIAVPA